MALLKLNENGRLCLKNTSGVEEIHPLRNVLLLIDTSGSMAGTKIAQAKQGAVDFARQAEAQHCSTALAVFGGRAAMVTDPALGSSAPERKLRAIHPGIVGYSTNLAAGLDLAAKFASLYAVVVVTDGMPDSQSSALSSASRLKDRGIEILCIGTDDADWAFLDQLATRSDFAMVVQPEDLGASMEGASRLLLGGGR